MDYITIHSETNLLIYKDYKFALIPSRINRHFSESPHRLNPTIRSQIEDYISHISSNLVTKEYEIKSRIQIFLNSFNHSSFIPELAIYSDGFTYSNCSYITRSINPIQNHLKEIHNWENPHIRERKKKLKENDPWDTNVSYQQFFKSRPEKEYFRVNSIRANPNRVPFSSRIEISQDRDSNSSESDSEHEDSNLLKSISQG